MGLQIARLVNAAPKLRTDAISASLATRPSFLTVLPRRFIPSLPEDFAALVSFLNSSL